MLGWCLSDHEFENEVVNRVTAEGTAPQGSQHDSFAMVDVLRDTNLTQADASLKTFSLAFGEISGVADLEKLSQAIVARVPYAKGVTGVYTTASQAFESATGVCQDHAHIFIACCRTLNIPARYVSGYLFTEHNDLLESHAWVDAWLDDLGWVSVDVSNQCLVNGAHVRLAVGLDYHDASPVSGIRVGGGVELMNAGVHVSQLPINKASGSREQMEQIQQ